MRFSNLLLLLIVFLISPIVQAEEDGETNPKNATAVKKGGALPKGDATQVDKDKAKAPKKKKRRRRNCFLDLTNPPGGNGFFTPDGGAFYLLANTGEEKAKGGKLTGKFTLYKINLKNLKIESILGMVHRKGASLITTGDPVKAVSAISFVGSQAGCYMGPSGMVTVSLEEDSNKPIKARGKYQLVRSPNGFMLVDLKSRSVLELDSKSFQTRKAVSHSPRERPLWYEPSGNKLAVWVEGKTSGLKWYNNSKLEKNMAFRRGHRVLQDRSKFGVAVMKLSNNTVEIRELAKWSGVEKDNKYTIKVPPAYTVTSGGVDINFENKFALVYGANFLAKQKWQRVFVYKYDQGSDVIGAIPVTGNQFLNYSGIDPMGKVAIIESADITTRQTTSLKLFDLKTRKYKELKLPEPSH